jgi:hypothetical protein
MSTNDLDVAVWVYDQHAQAENAVTVLRRACFDMNTISVIGKDYQTEEHVIGFLLGPVAAMVFSGLEGAVMVGGANALAGALTSIGIPQDSVLSYETALRANKFMLLVHGDKQEISRAYEVLKSSRLTSFQQHPAQSEPPTAAPAYATTTARDVRNSCDPRDFEKMTIRAEY